MAVMHVCSLIKMLKGFPRTRKVWVSHKSVVWDYKTITCIHRISYTIWYENFHQRMNCNTFADPSTFNLAPSDQVCPILCNIPTKLMIFQSQLYFVFAS